MKKKNKINWFIVIPFILFLLFIFYNVFWYLSVYRPYIPFCEVLEKSEEGYYRCIEDDISYYVDPPSYLRFTGNLAISQAVVRDGDKTIDMIIWRRLDGTYDVGIMLNSYEVKSDGEVRRDSVQFMIDEDMKLIEANEYTQDLLEENIDYVEKYYGLAYEKWGILGVH